MNNIEHANVAAQRFFETVFPDTNPTVQLTQHSGGDGYTAHVSIGIPIPRDITNNPQGPFGVFEHLRESVNIPGDEAQKLKEEIEELRKENKQLRVFKTHYNLSFYAKHGEQCKIAIPKTEESLC